MGDEVARGVETGGETTPSGSEAGASLELLLDVPLRVTVELGGARLSIRELLQLGHGSVVLPGSHIGKHVVVAAGAIVAGMEVPDFSVVAGVPARVVRRYEPGAGWVPAGNSNR